MFSKKILVGTIGSAMLLAAGYSLAVPIDTIDQLIAREASEGPRGGDNERPGDRQRRGGRNGAIDNPAENFVTAREASEGPRGGDNERPGDRQRRGGKVIEQIDILAREGAASNNQRNRQRRGGAEGGFTVDMNSIVVAREASEGPRGGDNERPGDRQRRGGRQS